MISYKQEIVRKLFHQLGLIIPVSYLFISKQTLLTIIVPITVLAVVVDIIRLKSNVFGALVVKFFGKIVRQHELEKFAGTTFFLSGSVLAISLFPKNYAILSLFFLTISDTAAALVGKKFGRHKFFEKSVEGSMAFFLSALIIGFALRDITLYETIIGAISGTIFEALPVKIDDNFTIPIGTCIILTIM